MTKKILLLSAHSFVVVLVLFIIKLETKKSNIHSTEQFKVETFITTDGGWGYHIYAGEKRIITQNVIPAIQKTISFQTKNDAEKAGNLVVSKLKKNKLPTLKTEELELLQIAI